MAKFKWGLSGRGYGAVSYHGAWRDSSRILKIYDSKTDTTTEYDASGKPVSTYRGENKSINHQISLSPVVEEPIYVKRRTRDDAVVFIKNTLMQRTISKESMLVILQNAEYPLPIALSAVADSQFDWDSQASETVEILLDENDYTRREMYQELIDRGFDVRDAFAGVEAHDDYWKERALDYLNEEIEEAYFSRQNMIDFMLNETFAREDITYAIDHCSVDWEEEAIGLAGLLLEEGQVSTRTELSKALLARKFSYQEINSAINSNDEFWKQSAIDTMQQELEDNAYSEEVMIDSLLDDGFDIEDVNYAISNSNIDWDQQAMYAARYLAEDEHMSRGQIIDELKDSGFTASQAEAAVKSIIT